MKPLEEFLAYSHVFDDFGSFPSRVVLHSNGREYVTHIYVIPEKGDPYLVWGNYIQKLEDAVEDFLDRCKCYRTTVEKKVELSPCCGAPVEKASGPFSMCNQCSKCAMLIVPGKGVAA